MKKFPVILIILIAAALPSFSDTVLTGGIQYTTETARNELLDKEPATPDSLLLLKNIVDENFRDNSSALLKGNAALKDRTLAIFSDKSYAVMYHDNPLYVWYYSPEGGLTHIEVKDGTGYPHKSYKYDIEGKLVNMGLRVSKAETFIFNPDGKLIAHWIKDKGYDENGKVIMTRKYRE